MAPADTFEQLNGLFKEAYGDDLENLIPDNVVLMNKIPFAKREAQLGNLYHQPVILGHEHGMSVSQTDNFALEPAIAGVTQDAQIRGTMMVLRAVLGYGAVSRSVPAGAKAFKDATKFVVGNTLRSFAKKLEIMLMYGQAGYGILAAGSTNTSLVIENAEWAPGIWAGAENMKVEVRDSTGAVSRGSAVITAVNFETKTVTVGAGLAGVVATDVVHHHGFYGNEFAGLHKILTNTGTLFNINASSYVLWKGNEYDAAGAELSFEKLQGAIAKAVEKGLDSDVSVIVNPKTWANLLTEQAALRMYDSSYKPEKAETGSKSLMFHGQNGIIEIVPSIYCKEGFAYVLSLPEMLRVGSSEITFKRPGREDMVRELENNAGFEIRAYCDQSLFCASPGKNVLIKNIVNS